MLITQLHVSLKFRKCAEAQLYVCVNSFKRRMARPGASGNSTDSGSLSHSKRLPQHRCYSSCAPLASPGVFYKLPQTHLMSHHCIKYACNRWLRYTPKCSSALARVQGQLRTLNCGIVVQL